MTKKMKVLTSLGGKGGVGKSTFAVNYALKLVSLGFDVGLIDFDISGPNVPRILGLGKVHLKADQVVEPVIHSSGLKVFSIGFDLRQKDYVKWKGEQAVGILNEFITGINWGQLDYLVIDSPPGTGDEIIVQIDTFVDLYAMMVVLGTPSGIDDAERTINLLVNSKVRIIGVVENYKGLYPFDGSVEELAKRYKLKYLGGIPFDPQIAAGLGTGDNSALQNNSDFSGIVSRIVEVTKGR